VTVTAITQRLSLPRRVVVILEGESLVNDATALVTWRIAVAATAGAFSLLDAAGQFVVVPVGGVLVGIVTGWLFVQLERRLHDPPVEITLTLIVPLATYLLAEELGVSGVLATVTAGLILGWNAPRIMTSDTRIAGAAVWETVLFLINGLAFILIGLQLRTVLEEIGERTALQLVGLGVAISVTVIVARILWVFPATYLPRLIPAIRRRDPPPPPRAVFVVAWAGLRGVVSLAAALALPQGFPERHLIIFLAFCVILATLVGQGLTLPLVIRLLGVRDDGRSEHEEVHARELAVQAALTRIDGLETEWPNHLELIENLRSTYAHRAEHAMHDHDETGEEHDVAAVEEAVRELEEHRQIRHEVIQAERLTLLEMRDRGEIGDEVLRRLERDLDLEELRMEA
jgi:CPA1 family monovalent cation:H+ antiporter